MNDLFANLPAAGRTRKALPPIPETGWTPPIDFPRLDAAKRIAIDCETFEPDNFDKGPGVRRGGYIVGLAVGTDDAQWYFPMRHDTGGNFDPDMVLRWAREQLTRPNQPKVGANLLYDLDYLYHVGVEVTGPFLDVQIAEPLIDETRASYTLDSLAQKYLNQHKVHDALYEWSARAYGGRPGRKQAANIYRCPVELVGPYAEGDVRLPLQILDKQMPVLESEGLLEVWDLETRLVPVLLAMRRRGVRVDVEKARTIDDDLTGRIDTAQAALNAYAGREVNVNAAASIAPLFDKAGIHYPLTPKSKEPSITDEWLASVDHPVATHVRYIRKMSRARDMFIRGHILGHEIDGRIYASFHPLKKDDAGSDSGTGGTVSGRFSCDKPNLQNIPSRDPELGPLIRGLFLPEPGELYAKADYSQVEFRLVAHFGRGESARAVRQAYIDDSSTDFHQQVAEMMGVARGHAKNLNFGLIYGMGYGKLADSIGCTFVEAKDYKRQHRDMAPFVQELSNTAEDLAKKRAWVKTLMGRRSRFNLWEPKLYPSDTKGLSDDEMKAVIALRVPTTLAIATANTKAISEIVGKRIRVVRAYAYKALNRVIQGSAADVMKKAMVDIWESGVCDILGAPLLTVHDELGFSVPQTGEGRQALDKALRIMETCVTVKVPLLVDCKIGTTWGDVE